MLSKYSFWTLCDKYDKIEIPIIQRDYAQGRATPEVDRIRDSFINDYLVDALLNNKLVELDFVYGSVFSPVADFSQDTRFIPLDGQQRLTTLFLLHWFLALKENRMSEASATLEKFTYETRPSAHDFCAKLIKKEKAEKLCRIRDEITESEWYDDEWDNDPTIRGMLTMLATFAENKDLLTSRDSLFDRLTDTQSPLISFYFIPLERFGLTENLYIRMNARGKLLTQFENFKSEFCNIIAYAPDLLEQVKDKIEYAWVDNLWDYREKKSFIIDNPFMSLLAYVSEMLYFKGAPFRSDEDYEDNFRDLKLLAKIYAKEDNVKFLIFVLDEIPMIGRYDSENFLWSDNSSISGVFKSILDGQKDIIRYLVLYGVFRYHYLKKPEVHFVDFIRVVRNLVGNTADNSRREWPRLLESIDKLITDNNIYDLLLQPSANDLMEGFYVPQRQEEILKAKILKSFPGAKKSLHTVEENRYLKGNIAPILASNFVASKKDFPLFQIEQVDAGTFDLKKFLIVYSSYKAISEQDFELIWGDLLNSNFYTLWWGRLLHDESYGKAPAVIALAWDYTKWPRKGTSPLEDFLRDKERKFIKDLAKKLDDFSSVRDVKKQLYLYYILHRRIMKKELHSFFAKGYNFGWLSKEKGFVSIFTSGIDGDNRYNKNNPIFQTYASRFMQSTGLKEPNALPAETVSQGRKNKPFQLLLEWANKGV